jgi:very-short-patch-repair endonuclease
MDAKTKLAIKNITQEFEARLNSLIDICESPIEEYFLVNICDYFYSQSLMSLRFDFLVRSIDDPYDKTTKIFKRFNYQERGINVFGLIYGVKIDIGVAIYKIIPQFQHNNYRLDFAIFIDKPDLKMKFCIECDGHDFHKTKDQNQKDSERTRALVKDGWTTLRYTGTELFKWDVGKAQELEIILTEFLKRNN